MSKRSNNRRNKRQHSSQQRKSECAASPLLWVENTQIKVRGKGRRPARIHRTIRLDVPLAEGITHLSELWECDESQVVRRLLRSGLELALHKPISAMQ